MAASTRNLTIIVGLVAFCAISFGLLIAGIVKQRKSDETCSGSVAKRVSNPQVISFIKKVQKTYYRMNPNKIVYMPDVTISNIRQEFSAYDAKPSSIKKRTDAARTLLAEINNMKLNEKNMLPRERKAVAQVKHYLQSNFGSPYDENYYAGDWMMGPNYFCWQPICYIGSDLGAHFNTRSYGFQPKSVDDVEFVIESIRKHGRSVVQYVENMKYGIKAGMVRSVEDCKSGLNSISGRFKQVSRKNKNAILEESFVRNGIKDKDYLKKLESTVQSSWRAKYKKSVQESIDEALINDFGKHIEMFIGYVKNNYSRHCVPDDKLGGLGLLPMDFVWVNQKEDKSQPTTKKLPTGEQLSGKKAYEMILPYFTTNSMTPDEIHNLGWSMLNSLYPQALELAKVHTKEAISSKAADRFKAEVVDSPSSYFNSTPIPDNESNADAFLKCTSMETAKLYCPVRYKSMLSWFDYVETTLATLHPKIRNFFYETGDRASTPNCPVRMVAKFNPSSGSQSYSGAGSGCTRPCYYQLPFYLTPPGPRYNAISVAAHEARPGHHTQVQGFNEHFSTTGSKDVIDWLNSETYYTAFTEGWALYSENPLLAQGTDIYKIYPLQKYGMLKWQIWRALRLIMDTGFHYKGMKRPEAAKLFKDYAWDTTEKATKDLTRYQSDPGQATAYMIGQLAIWKLRNYTKSSLEKAKITFNEKEFHFHVLSQGSSPLDYLDTYIKEFVACKISPKNDGCKEILESKRKINKSVNKESTAAIDFAFEEKPFFEQYE